MRPGGTIAALRNVSGGGSGAGNGEKGSEITKNLIVSLKGEASGPGSCPAGAASSEVNVSLELIDDDGDTILDATKTAVCYGGDTTYVKFSATFTGPENCKNSVTPFAVSRGDVSVTATSNGGTLNATRSVLCKRSSIR